MYKNILHFFDKLEDNVRGHLSRHPLVYALIAGTGVILFWRGIWHAADDISMSSSLSIVIGIVILLITGVFVSAFVGNRLLLSGLKGEKKLAEMTKEELETEEDELKHVEKILNKIEGEISDIENKIK